MKRIKDRVNTGKLNSMNRPIYNWRDARASTANLDITRNHGDFQQEEAELFFTTSNLDDILDEIGDSLQHWDSCKTKKQSAKDKISELKENDSTTNDEYYDAKMNLKQATLECFAAEKEHKELLENISERLSMSHPEDIRMVSDIGIVNILPDIFVSSDKEGISGGEVLKAAGLKVDNSGVLTDIHPNGLRWSRSAIARARVDEEYSIKSKKDIWDKVLGKQYESDNDCTVYHNTSFYSNSRYPNLVSNPDAFVVDADYNTHLASFIRVDNKYTWQDDIPADKRAEYLMNMKILNQPYTDIVVLVGDDVLVYRLYSDDVVYPHDAGNYPHLDIDTVMSNTNDTWDHVVEYMENSSRENTSSNINVRGDIPSTKNGRDEAVKNLHALLYPRSKEEITDLITMKEDQGASFDEAVRLVIGENFSRENIGTMTGIDLETSSIADSSVQDSRAFLPSYGDIIETGMVHYDAHGVETSRFSRLHGNHELINKHNGTGAVEVHHISVEDVAGKPRFNEPEENRLVTDEMYQSNVLVAHNDKFERKFLSYNLKDYDKDFPWLDTAWLTRHFSESTEGRARLQEFCADHGVDYVEAHRATNDADMMMRALNEFFKRENWWMKSS